jgi:hypothetical protein
MTVRPWNEPAAGAANAAPVVLILKKSQGSVWSEAGRTPLCPTVGWLRDNYGTGQYELRLKLGNRILCMANAECAAPAAAPLHSRQDGVAGLSQPDQRRWGGAASVAASHGGVTRRAIGGAW